MERLPPDHQPAHRPLKREVSAPRSPWKISPVSPPRVVDTVRSQRTPDGEAFWIADRVRLPQLGPEDLSEAGKLISKASASVEVEVPSVARKPPVADGGNLPVRPRFEVNYEIHAAAIWAVDLTPAENHLTTVPDTTDLPGRESERGQDRIESVRNEDLCTPVRTTTSCNQARTSVSRPRWNARPRHVR